MVVGRAAAPGLLLRWLRPHLRLLVVVVVVAAPGVVVAVVGVRPADFVACNTLCYILINRRVTPAVTVVRIPGHRMFKIGTRLSGRCEFFCQGKTNMHLTEMNLIVVTQYLRCQANSFKVDVGSTGTPLIYKKELPLS